MKKTMIKDYLEDSRKRSLGLSASILGENILPTKTLIKFLEDSNFWDREDVLAVTNCYLPFEGKKKTLGVKLSSLIEEHCLKHYEKEYRNSK